LRFPPPAKDRPLLKVQMEWLQTGMSDAEEIWKDIPSHPNRQASSLGRIRMCAHQTTRKCRTVVDCKRFEKEKLLPFFMAEVGYWRVSFGEKNHYVHRLVCEAFNGFPPDGFVVNHRDGNKLNNRPENLEWVTRGENNLHRCRVLGHARGEKHFNAKLTETDVLDIRILCGFGASLSNIAKTYGIGISAAHAIKHKRTWAHV